jgi:predicted ATPase
MVQMPALLPETVWAAVQRRVVGATQERMLRELAEALEAITAEQPLVLVLEDLHWSDYATLDLLGYLARRRDPARLLLIGTYRPVDIIMRAHPLKAVKQDLEIHGQSVEVALELLTEAEIAAYLTVRLGAAQQSSQAFQPLARALHQRTDGQPLFMVMVVEALVRQGGVGAGHREIAVAAELVVHTVPESLRQVIERHLEALLPEDQRLVEAASVVGLVWSAAAATSGLAAESEVVEQQCTRLGQLGQFFVAHGVDAWPDGTITECYRFRHALYPQVVYERVPVGQRIRLHRRIGARLEVGYGAHTAEYAAALALHFERGQDDERAVRYRQQAAATAL